MSKEKKLIYLKVVGIILLMLLISMIGLPYVRKLQDPAIQQEFQVWVDKMGIFGWIVLLAVQFIQVVIAFLPGEPVELIAGALYGGFIGLILCLAGVALGTTFIFSLSRKYGKKWLEKLFTKEKLEDFSFLQDSKKLEIVLFLLFLIPGTPKDMLTYFVGTTSITLFRFFGISLLARIPSIITSTYMGASVREGNWKGSIIVFLITGLIGVGGIVLKETVMHTSKRLSRHVHHIKMATIDEVDQIDHLMKEAVFSLEQPQLFVPDDRAFILRHIQEEGFILCAMRKHLVVAFLIVRYPKEEPDQLGYDLGYPKESFDQIAHIESIVVKKEYQGRKLQTQLLQAAEEKLYQENKNILLATVDPNNQYSLANFLKNGYSIRETKEKYNGLLRHIIEKRW